MVFLRWKQVGVSGLEVGVSGLEVGVPALKGGSARVGGGRARTGGGKARGGGRLARVLGERARTGGGKVRGGAGLARVRGGHAWVLGWNTRFEGGRTGVRAGRTRAEGGSARVEGGRARVRAGQTQAEDGSARAEAGRTRAEGGQTQAEGGSTRVRAGRPELEAGKAEVKAGPSQAKAGRTKPQIHHPREKAYLAAMQAIPLLDATFIEEHTDYRELIGRLGLAFGFGQVEVPPRHHLSVPYHGKGSDNTLLLMPSWDPDQDLGVKVITVSPNNSTHRLPSIQGCYLFFDSQTGSLKAILDAPSLTNKRTAATSALASRFLSRKDSKTMLMIGTGALAPELIRAHAKVRPLEKIMIWGRNQDKAQTLAESLSGLKDLDAKVTAVPEITPVIGKADIVSCATLSPTPIVLGNDLKPGQHIDLVGAFKPEMRESDNTAILRASVFLDTFRDGLNGSGDIFLPLANWIISEEHIKGDLFGLCRRGDFARRSDQEITLFKSVGYALEDLVAAGYYFERAILAK